MKKIPLLIVTILVFTISSFSQTTTFFPASNIIWLEDFSSYTNETGIATQAGAIINKGDYNSSFTKWSINSTGVNAGNTILGGVNNIINTNIYYPTFNVANTGGNLEWESEVIDVSAYTQTHLSVILEQEGNLSENEYIDVYWKVVNVGNYILIDDAKAGHTVVGTSGEECWKIQKIFKDLTTTGTNRKVQIKVVFKSTNINNVLKLKKVAILGYNN